jgi:Ca2+:H+ antiporter
MCFLFGGLKYHEQEFNSTVASTMSSLMAVATSSLIIPAALYATLEKTDASFHLILQLSRGTSIVILILYIMYLVFQLKTHTDLFSADTDEDSGPEHAELNPIEAGVVLVLVTVLVAVCAEYLVGSIEGIVETSGISKTFIGLILIPIVGNAAEHVTAIVVALKNKVGVASSFILHPQVMLINW